MFVMGPQHTANTADRIVDFALDNNINSIQVSIITPLPGTPLYDEMKPHLFLTDYPKDWDYYDGTHCTYDHSIMDVDEFQEKMYKIHQRFYRLCAFNSRSLRSIFGRPMSMMDKFHELYANGRTTVKLMKAWRSEIDEFLEDIRGRTPRLSSGGQ
jgi:radical SAM superfamily enzyme YgiQ (UPF0313 family)